MTLREALRSIPRRQEYPGDWLLPGTLGAVLMVAVIWWIA